MADSVAGISREVVGGITSMIMGLLLLFVSAGTADITKAIVGRITTALNVTGTTYFSTVASTASSIFSIVGVALIAVGGALTIWALLKSFGIVKAEAGG